MGPAQANAPVSSQAAQQARPAPRALTAAARRLASHRVPLALLGLTAFGFALRLVVMSQTLYGDERLTFAIVTGNGFTGVWQKVYDTSITPPLHYYLAWLAVQLGGNTAFMARLPSLLLGTASIPLLFSLGRRIGGSRAGLFAAGILALSPFAIFYSTEARTYETVVFLVTVSTLALLKAEDGEGRVWWLVYVVSSCAALWAHYTAVFVLIAQAVWAFWARPQRRRPLVIAEAAIVVGYLPWLPGYLNQRKNPGVDLFDEFGSPTIGKVFDFPLRTLVAHPFVGLGHVPGAIGFLLVLGLMALVLAAVARRPTLPRSPSLRSELALILILAVATPVGLLIYGLVGSNLFSAERELSASEPALVVLVAVVLASLVKAAPARVAAVTVAGMAAVLGVIAVRSTEAAYQRPPYREIAHYLDSVAGGSPVVQQPLPLVMDADEAGVPSTLSDYFERPHPVYRAGKGDDAAWRQERAGATLFVVEPQLQPLLHLFGLQNEPPGLLARRAMFGGPDGRAVRRATRTFPGFHPLVVERYRGVVKGSLERRGGKETIVWFGGNRVSVRPGVARGEVTAITASGKPLLIAGWAMDASRRTPADWFLFFSRDRLFAVSAGGASSQAAPRTYGSLRSYAGFGLGLRDGAPANHSTVRVFAVVGNRASELPLSAGARRMLGSG